MHYQNVKQHLSSLSKTIFVAILLAFLSLCVSLSYSVEAHAENMDKGIQSRSYKNGNVDAYFKVPLHYNDEGFFGQSSAVFNNDLAYASACLAFASGNASTTDWSKGPEMLLEFFQNVGCPEHAISTSYTSRPTEVSNVAVGIAHKTITIDEQDYKLFIVGVRGDNYLAEWSLNLRIGNEGEHAGFGEARDTVLSFILPYIKSHTQEGDKIKIWCAGMSRGGAISNLVCGWLNKWAYERSEGHTYNNEDYTLAYNAEHSVYGKSYNASTMINEEKEYFPLDYLPQNVQLSNDDIYCYPISAPAGALKEDADKHQGIMKGIHNCMNPDDLVPLVVPAQWGFVRYGYTQDHDITGTYPADGTWAERPLSMLAVNKSGIDAMLARLKAVNPVAAYSNPWFQQYYISHWLGLRKDNSGEGNFYIDKDKTLNKNFGRYGLEFMSFLVNGSDLGTRQAYVSQLQDSISYLMGLYFGLTEQQKNDFVKYMKANLNREIGSAVGDSKFDMSNPGSSFLKFINKILLADSNGSLRTILSNSIRPALTSANIQYDTYAIEKCCTDFSIFANRLCKTDKKYLYHITTMAKNSDMVKQAHMQESVISWWAASAGALPDPQSDVKKHLKFHSKPYEQADTGDEVILEIDLAEGQECVISSDDPPVDDQGRRIDNGIFYYQSPQLAGYLHLGWKPYPMAEDDDDYYYVETMRLAYSKLPDNEVIDFYPDMSDLAIYGIEYHANRPDNDDTDTIYSEANEESLFVEDRGFERPDYEFTGWNTKKDGSGQSFKANENTQLSALGLMSTQAYHEAIGTEGDPDILDRLVTQNTKVLYAQWKRTTPPAAPVIQTQPRDLTWTIGDKTARSLSVTATSPDGGTLSYQWYEDGKKIEGATKNVLSIDHPEKRAAGTYRFSCVVLNTVDGLGSATTSHTATVVVKPTAKAPVIEAQPNDLTWKKGDKTSRWLEVSAYAPDKGTISYQWYENGKAIKGATSNTYVIPNPEKHVVGKTVYYCEITNTLEDTKNTVTSRKATVIVTAVAAAPVIKKQPVNVVWTKGDKTSRSLQVIAVSPDNGKLSYQWYENGQAIQGATSNTYVIPTPEKRGVGKSIYYCVVTNTRDGAKQAVSTQKVTATVRQKAASAVFVPRLKMTSSKANALKLTWNKNANAQGYDIFFGKVTNVKKAIKYKKIKTIKDNKTVSFTKTKLAKQTAYAAYVKAYKVVKGKKVYLPATPAVVALTSNGNKTYTNAKAVVVQTSSITLSKGKTFQIKSGVAVVTPKKKVMTTKTIPFMRYYTNNPKIVKVSKTGKIKAVGKGSCTLYAVASNGVSKALKVTVK